MKRINGTKIEWYGYCLDLLDGMQKEMNDSFTFEMYEVPDGQYGRFSSFFPIYFYLNHNVILIFCFI